MVRVQNRGFTLVELIVVITILAILGTIWFISLQGYSLSARESTRLSDLNTISKSLELFRTTNNYYPDPTNPFQVTYTGVLAWNQWIFWENTRTIVERISQVPVDPLTQNPYAYSITNTKQEYELWAISENGYAYGVLTPQTYAANGYSSMIKGNYNQKFVSVRDTSNIYILWVPTIITSEINSVTVDAILSNQSFAVRNTKNLPWSYNNSLPSGQTLKDGISFTPGTLSGSIAPIVYMWGLTNLNSDSEKQKLWQNLKSYYQGSNLTEKNIPTGGDIFKVLSGQELSYVNNILLWEQGGLTSKEFIVNTTPQITTPSVFTLTGPFDVYDYSSALNNFGGENNMPISTNATAFAALKSDGSISAWGASGAGGTGAPTGTWYIWIYQTAGWAFAALKSDGSISAWGANASGGTGAPTGTGYTKIFSTQWAFAALKSDGSISVWWDTTRWGTGAPTGTWFTAIYSNMFAFAALRADGTILTWGNSSNGGNNITVVWSWYTKISSTQTAFAALKSDGSIWAWWLNTSGWAWAPTWTGYINIFSNNSAFAALKSDGSITVWGNASNGGTWAPTGTGYITIVSTNSSFAAMKSDGTINIWGGISWASATIYVYTKIIANQWAFAALKSDGSITTWWPAFFGGTGAPTGTWYTNIYNTSDSFAAMKADGSITSWGNASIWAPTGTGYVRVYTNYYSFAAMKADGSISAWGISGAGWSWAPTGTWYVVISWVKQ